MIAATNRPSQLNPLPNFYQRSIAVLFAEFWTIPPYDIMITVSSRGQPITKIRCAAHIGMYADAGFGAVRLHRKTLKQGDALVDNKGVLSKQYLYTSP